MKHFATAIPGIGPLLLRELSRRPGLHDVVELGCDGRNDVVGFTTRGVEDDLAFRLSEDVFVEATTSRRGTELEGLVRDLSNVEQMNRALSVYAQRVRPLRRRMEFRVIARVLTENSFRRTQLRDALQDAVTVARPRWSVADPASLETWAMETSPRRYRLGIRLTDASMRHRGGRTEERAGALRPSVAAAMVFLAGLSGRERVLDPFCGSGTILAESLPFAATVLGADRDDVAVAAASRNVPGARVISADARKIPVANASVDAVVTNPPFGSTHVIDGPVDRWAHEVLAEICRVCVPGAPVVLLLPEPSPVARALARCSALELCERFPLSLLGRPACVWHLRHQERLA